MHSQSGGELYLPKDMSKFNRYLRYKYLDGAFTRQTHEQRTATASAGGPAPCKKTAHFFEFSLCLSRACLGKKMIFSLKWSHKTRFPYVSQFHVFSCTSVPSWST
jgi:hypothetical protein